jgi:signal transduction histidine kinase
MVSVKNKIMLLVMFLLVSSIILVGLFLGTRPIVDVTGNVVINTPLKYDGFIQNFYSIGIATFVLLIFISLFIVHMLIKPLDKVIIGTQLVTEGDLSQKIDKQSNDEFGRLVESFNKMVSKLKAEKRYGKKVKGIASKERIKKELIIESMGDGVIVTDSANKIIVFNKSAEDIFDINASKAIGKHILQLKKYGLNNLYIDPDTLTTNINNINLEKNKKNSSKKCNFRDDCLEFEIKPLNKIITAIVSPVLDNNSTRTTITTTTSTSNNNNNNNLVFSGAVCIIRDITKQRRTENMKTEFLSTVSHELRTPLTNIKGYTSLLNSGKFGDINYRQSKALKIIIDQSDVLVELIDNMLDISKLESDDMKLNKTSVSLKQCLTECNTIELAKKQRIKIKINIPKNIPLIVVDKQKLIQVLNHIIDNSIKFIGNGDMITISAKKIINSTKKKEKFIEITILDNGKGIKKQDLDTVFDKFYQAEEHMVRTKGGSGLGLPIVKKILEAFGGKISIKSKLNQGTTISFTLPV